MNTKEQKLEVNGMTCNHCVMNVEKHFKALNGVADAKVSLEGKSAVVTYDADVLNPNDLPGALADTNYTAALA